VVNNGMKHDFDAQTDMEWLTFLDQAHSHFEMRCNEVLKLVYRIGEKGPMSKLEDKDNWDKAMCQLRQKIRAARSCQMSMEIRKVVS
jgi:hypothetical protein